MNIIGRIVRFSDYLEACEAQAFYYNFGVLFGWDEGEYASLVRDVFKAKNAWVAMVGRIKSLKGRV